MSELKAYTEEELAEHQQLYDEVFTPVWESEGQYCRAGGGQYEKSFAWWAFKHQQSKIGELQKRLDAVKDLVIELKKLDMENGSIEITSEFVEEIICDLEQALKGGCDEAK